jgi:hypothetical protein
MPLLQRPSSDQKLAVPAGSRDGDGGERRKEKEEGRKANFKRVATRFLAYPYYVQRRRPVWHSGGENRSSPRASALSLPKFFSTAE